MEKSVQNPDLKVLIIDDEPTFVEALTWWLKAQYQVTAIVGGKDAAEVIDCENGKFDVILCDLNMPEFDGVDLYGYVSEKYPGLEKHLIFLTGGAFTQKSQDFLKMVKNVCLDKPFTREELYTAIQDISVL